jgi:predicted transcriptional regulator
MSNRNLIFGIGIIVSFALLIFSVSLYLNYRHDLMQQTRLSPDDIDNMTKTEIKSFLEERRENEQAIHSFYFLPFTAFVGLLVGTLVYYVMAGSIVQKDYTIKKNYKVILGLLNRDERKVIELLLEQEGKAPQYELSHLPNLNKVKTHRILQNLEQKGIIYKEKIGKINKVVLNKELYNILKEEK